MGKRISDHAVVEAVLTCGGSIPKAAVLLNCGRSTIYERVQNSPEVREAIHAAQSGAIQGAAVQLTQTAVDAVNTLRGIMQNTENAASVRASAADAILRHTAKYYEVSNTAQRLDALEEAVQEQEAYRGANRSA